VGLFDLFGSREERERNALRKQAQRLTQKYGPPENRQKIIQQLGEQGTAAALSVLCLRFTVLAEPGITDAEEKESVRQSLVAAGERAIGPVKAFIEEQESGVSWGLRVLAALVPPDEVVATAVKLLHRLGREYTRDPEKKLVLLGWLAEHHSVRGAGPPEDMQAALLPLLEDFSDDVRIAAVRVLAQQKPGERERAALIELLLRDKDNARVRGDVLQALCDLQADVKGHRPSVEALLVEPYFLDREGRVKRRGT